MPLKATVETLDGIPAELHQYYVKTGDTYALAVDGMAPKEKVTEFRESNIALRKQLEEMAARFDGIDPDRARELAEKAQKQRDKQLIDAGKVDEMVAERVNTMKAGYEKQLGDITAEKTKITTQLEGLVIDGAIRDASAKAGVRPEAIEDVLLRGRSLFKLTEGKAVPMDGDKPVYGKSGDPMDISEWVGGLADRAPHLFVPSTGSGSKAANGSAAPGLGRISRTDNAAFFKNLDAIAEGKIQVVD